MKLEQYYKPDGTMEIKSAQFEASPSEGAEMISSQTTQLMELLKNASKRSSLSPGRMKNSSVRRSNERFVDYV